MAQEWLVRTINRLTPEQRKEARRLLRAKRDPRRQAKGRLVSRSTPILELLLVHYAYEVDNAGGDLARALGRLIDYERRVGRVQLSPRSMQNLLSRALHKVNLDDLPPWARQVAEERKKRGFKSKAPRSKKKQRPSLDLTKSR